MVRLDSVDGPRPVEQRRPDRVAGLDAWYSVGAALAPRALVATPNSTRQSTGDYLGSYPASKDMNVTQVQLIFTPYRSR